MDISTRRKPARVVLTRGDRWKEMTSVYKGPGLSIPVPDESIPGPGMYPVHTKGAIQPYVRTPSSPEHWFGSSAHDTRLPPPSDEPGPGSFSIKSTIGNSSKLAGKVAKATRDQRAKTFFGAGAPPAIPHDTPGAGAYTINRDFIQKRPTAKAKHTFGSAPTAASALQPSDTPGPGAYFHRRAMTAASGSRMLAALASPIHRSQSQGALKRASTLSRAGSKAGLSDGLPSTSPKRSAGPAPVGGVPDDRSSGSDSDGERGSEGGRGQRHRTQHPSADDDNDSRFMDFDTPRTERPPSPGGVGTFRQSVRSAAMVKRDAEFKRAQRRRQRLYKPRSHKSKSSDATAAFLELSKGWLEPKSRKERLSEEARDDPFTDLRAPNPRVKHMFGASCHEIPLVPDNKNPGPGAHNVPGTLAAQENPDVGVLFIQARSPKPGIGFARSPKMPSRKEDATGPGPSAPARSSFPEPEAPTPWGRKSTWGSTRKDIASKSNDSPGPGAYDIAKSTLKPPPGGPGPAVGHYFGATSHDLPTPNSDIPGPSLPQRTTFKFAPVAPQGKHTFGAGHVIGHSSITPGPNLSPRSTLKPINPHGPDHTFGSGSKQRNLENGVPGPGQYTPKELPKGSGATVFGGKGDLKHMFLGKLAGQKGQWGPSERTHTDDITKGSRASLFPKSKRPLVQPKDGPGPGQYGPSHSLSTFIA